ncbi:hypothetical protein L7F22_068558 [Adiantum nelumboides]|nr:hypothetical protein [Adiantum nelumboides]
MLRALGAGEAWFGPQSATPVLTATQRAGSLAGWLAGAAAGESRRWVGQEPQQGRRPRMKLLCFIRLASLAPRIGQSWWWAVGCSWGLLELPWLPVLMEFLTRVRAVVQLRCGVKPPSSSGRCCRYKLVNFVRGLLEVSEERCPCGWLGSVGPAGLWMQYARLPMLEGDGSATCRMDLIQDGTWPTIMAFLSKPCRSVFLQGWLPV